jgi:hypothetical protein
MEWVHPAVTASTMIAPFLLDHKVRCHSGVVEITWERGSSEWIAVSAGGSLRVLSK